MKSIDTAKYRKIFETLRKELRDGLYPSGVPLPSEESLIRKYNVSRITAVRAMDELVKCGLVYRKRGGWRGSKRRSSATFVTDAIAMKRRGRFESPKPRRTAEVMLYP